MARGHRICKGLAAAALVGSVAVGGAAVAGAGEGESAVLTVTKTVEGTAPADAQFVINVYCVDTFVNAVNGLSAPAGNGSIVYDDDIQFGPGGGSEQFVFFEEASCVITEIEDGGATSSTGPVEVDILEPEAYAAEIVNTFEAQPTTTSTTTATAAADAIRVVPAFTG